MPSKRPLGFLFLILVILVGGYLVLHVMQNDQDVTLTASGTIEAVEINISPEIGGKVIEIYVEEGDSVRAGEQLFRLDDSLLQAQRGVAIANLEAAQAAAKTADAALASAQANYDLALNDARLKAAAIRTAEWRTSGPPDYHLPPWYFQRPEEIASAQQQVEVTQAALQAAQQKLEALLQDAHSAAFLAAETRLLQAKAAFLVAQELLEKARLARENASLREAAQKIFDEAQEELRDAQNEYDDLADRPIAEDIREARADLAAAQEQYELAQDRLLAMKIGVYSPQLAAAEASLNQAKAAANQAQLAISQAEANLAWIDAQIAKLTILSPANGVILTRAIQPGEVVSPGASALVLGRLDDLNITVFIPEDRYGEISLGQSATVKVDSYPKETFSATVIHIAERAEFTPRNVQTVEGRKTTVFAIKLRLVNLQGKLKPGMPADVIFEAGRR